MVATPPSPPEPTADAAPGGAYRNLFVPLVVVPFLVVGVIALVFVFFGAIRGEDPSMEENLRTAVEGGANERKQAVLSLVAQALENSVALAEGREAPWPAPEDFAARLQRAWDQLPVDDDPQLRLVLAQLLAQQGDPGALDKLADVLATADADDPEGEVRAYAMLAATWLQDERAAGLLIPFLDHDDPFLRQTAAGALQKVPGEATLEALRGLLDEASLELRGQAAISLASLGDASGAEVLRELVRRETYGSDELAQAGKFQGERSVHEARLEGVRGLGRLGLSEDRALLEGLAADDPDHAVREAAMRALSGASDEAGGASAEGAAAPARGGA